MGHVVIAVNDRTYTMQCADGEEHQLTALAAYLDSEVKQIREQVGPVGDLRLLLMAGLLVADKLSEAQRKLEAYEDQVQGLRQSRNVVVKQSVNLEDDFADRLDQASEKLEQLALAFREID